MKFISKLAGIATGAFLGAYFYEKVVHQNKKDEDVEEDKPSEDIEIDVEEDKPSEDIEIDVEDLTNADSLKGMTDEDITSLGD
jgi:hypothetical protein